MNFQDIIRNVYDQDQNLLRTSTGGSNATVYIGTPTIFAVVNTAASGQASVVIDGAVAIKGNLTLSDPKNFIGLVSIGGGILEGTIASGSADSGNPLKVGGKFNSTKPTFTDGQRGDFQIGSRGELIIGLYNGSQSADFSADNADGAAVSAVVSKLKVVTRNTVYNPGTTQWDRMPGDTSGVYAQIKGNVTLTDSKGFIGLATTVNAASPAFIGIVTVTNKDRTITGNITLSDAKTYVGLTTTTLGVGTTFIGLVTAWSRNAGTTKTLVNLPVGLGNNSLSTVAVPTNNQKINIAHILLNSNVTTEIALKSGVTYLTGNASLGVTLFPGGGFVMDGSPDSPVWISLPSGALVVEKRDGGGTVSKIAGSVVYFDE